MNTIPLTSDQAAKVAALQPGEKCELTFVSDWQPPKDAKYARHSDIIFRYRLHKKWKMHRLEPPCTLNTIYGVLEPHNRIYFQDGTIESRFDFDPQYRNYDAHELPVEHIRSHIIIHKLTPKIEDGVLVWDAVVERVEP
jgi:hypothetical protein